jgi:hypothetical protein
MALFQDATNTSAFLKAGFLGFAGSGKTYTAATLARDLVKHMKQLNLTYAHKPVVFLDTETGSNWVRKMFETENIPFKVAKTRAFSDLLVAVPEAEATGSVLIIDSISHFWKELCDSYLLAKATRLKRNVSQMRLEFQDWGYLKGEWGKFTDLFINSQLHIILCGRAGYEYDYFENDHGKKELEKTGVKMKAEGEMGYEPSLLLLMERVQKMDGGSVENTWREGTVLKDRSTLLDGKTFVNPKFRDFQPHIDCLNLGATQLGVDTTRTTRHDLGPDTKDYGPVQRKIVLGEIQDLMVLHIPGMGAADKQRKVALIRQHFGAGWVEVEEVMKLSDLRAGYDSLHKELEGTPSRYSAVLAPKVEGNAPNADMGGDSLPDHSAPPVQASEPVQQQELEAKPEAPAADFSKMDINEVYERLAGCETIQQVMAWGVSCATRNDDVATRTKLANAMRLKQGGLLEVAEAAKRDKPKRERKPKAEESADEGAGASMGG